MGQPAPTRKTSKPSPTTVSGDSTGTSIPAEQVPFIPQTQVPYGKKASGWLLALKDCLVQAEITPKARHALESMAAKELRTGIRLDWSTTQLGTDGGCDRRTMDRNIGKLLAHGLIEVTEVGCHELRKATLYRLSRLLPTFQNQGPAPAPAPASTSPAPSQRAVCPSPLDLRSKKTNTPTHPNIQNTPEDVPMVANVPPTAWEGFREEILQALSALGVVNPKGFRDTEAVSPFAGEEALRVARAAVIQAPSKANRTPVGWALAALRGEAFGRSLLSPSEQVEPERPTWGEETAAVEAKLTAIPADSAGIASAKKRSWCDGVTALLVLDGCQSYWAKGHLPANPGGYAVQALVVRSLGEAMLVEAGIVLAGVSPLGAAVKEYRQNQAESRLLARLHPEGPDGADDAHQERVHQLVYDGFKLLYAMADALRALLPEAAFQASLQTQLESYGLPRYEGGPKYFTRSMEAQAAVRAGLAAGLISGWDFQAIIDPRCPGRERAAA